MRFSGSYDHGQVEFLVKVLPAADFISVEDKEKLIQTGKKHYSQMLSLEKLPSAEYMDIFKRALSLNCNRMAKDCLILASKINTNRPNGAITLISLLRAGTPIGVILKKILEKVFNRNVVHYSISIMRDIGIDTNALRFILSQGSSDKSIVFVDGWTGKGVISNELFNSVSRFNTQNNTVIDTSLYVIADIAGKAKFSASNEDYLIPSCILNSTVSGLVSRTVYNESIGPDDFHGSFFYAEYLHHDQSRYFVTAVADAAIEEATTNGTPDINEPNISFLLETSEHFINQSMNKYSVTDQNFIKPGIGEATRVLLRRVPRLLILRNIESNDVAHLVNLAKQKSVLIEIDHSMPYQAVSLIGSSLDG